jgi:hypothetical protein
MLRAPRSVVAVQPLPADWQPRFCTPCWPPCPKRMVDIKEGRMLFDFKRDGWLYDDYYVTGVVHRECVHCGGELPDAARIFDNLTNGSEGEE